jgi:5-methylcytosine-specific restriction endonuclease McrA
MALEQFKGPYRRVSKITRRQEKKAASEKQGLTFTQRVKKQKGLCWFCNEPMGYDCTKEHLLARARGGSNDLANIRAAHGDCNSAAGHLPVKRKYELRKIGHAAGRQAVLEAAHRMRRHETYRAFVSVSQRHKPIHEVEVIKGPTDYDTSKFTAAAKARRRLEAEQAAENARLKREARKHYWAKLGLLQKPEWWDG